MPDFNPFPPVEGRGAEDALTARWCFLLNQLPTLGQAFADYVADTTGLPRAHFQQAIDHPTHGRGVRDFPDMLLATDAWRVLFEHKLEAPCNNDQLGRYRNLAATLEDTRLAFMAPDAWDIAADVLKHPLYLKPRDADHFYWSDVYPLVASDRSPLAGFFTSYLDEEGLKPEGWGGVGDPFTRGNDRARQVMAEVTSALALPWRARKQQPSHWDAIEMRMPLPGVNLAYLKLKRTMGAAEPRIIGQAVELIIWTPSDNDRILPRVTGRLAGDGPTVFVRPDWAPRRMKGVKGEVYFTMAMRDVLGDSLEAAVVNLVAFANRVMTYVRDGGRIIEDGASNQPDRCPGQ